MVLFGVLRKDAAQVTKQDPLELELEDPLPDDLREYENEFLAAFEEIITRQAPPRIAKDDGWPGKKRDPQDERLQP